MDLYTVMDRSTAPNETGNFSSENLDNLVGELKKKGVSSRTLCNRASHWWLGSCSYGSFRSFYPILGAIVGNIIGAGASLVCNDACDRFYATEANRIIANGISFALPNLFFTSAGFHVRKSHDSDFYYRIREFYKDKLSN